MLLSLLPKPQSCWSKKETSLQHIDTRFLRKQKSGAAGSQISQGIKKTRFQWDYSKKNLGFPGLHEKRAKTSWDSVGDSKKTACSDSRKKLGFFLGLQKTLSGLEKFFVGLQEKILI